MADRFRCVVAYPDDSGVSCLWRQPRPRHRIDEYQDRNNINPLGAAAKDAKDLSRTLTEVAEFPKANVRLLTSDGENKPTGANIVFERAAQLAKAVKPGDTVFFAFSGHGVESEADEITYPPPYDRCPLRSHPRSHRSPTELFKQIKRLPKSRAVLIALDMCRNDPKKGARDVTATNRLGKRQAEVPGSGDRIRRWRGTPTGALDRPKLIVHLFKRAVRASEAGGWTARQRGYFSYFLEG